MNWMIYVRGPAQNYDDWASMGCPGWDYQSVLPYFKKYEGNQNQSLVDFDNGYYHSATGPVKVESPQITGLHEVFFDALRNAGVEIVPDFNANYTLGYSPSQLLSFNGLRSSSAQEYLSPARNRSNLYVIKEAFVDKIILDEKNRATGVEFTYKGKHKMLAYTKKEVIVSAGAIQSPPLLMRSGIGPKKHLEENNVTCKVDLPVGESYIDHTFAHLMFSFDKPATGPLPNTFPLDSLYEYAVDHSGPLINSPDIAGYVDTTNVGNQPNIKYGFSIFPQGTPAATIEGLNNLTDFPLFNDIMLNVTKTNHIYYLIIILLAPKSRGEIRLDKCKKCGDATIYGNYLSDPNDRQTLIQAIKLHMQLRETKPFQDLGSKFIRVPLEECDQLEYQSDAYWGCYLKYCTTSGLHVVGTSKMGNDSSAVVDHRLKVRHVQGLRQIDNGVIPLPIRANTNAVALMVGEKGADLVKEDYC